MPPVDTIDVVVSPESSDGSMTTTGTEERPSVLEGVSNADKTASLGLDSMEMLVRLMAGRLFLSSAAKLCSNEYARSTLFVMDSLFHCSFSGIITLIRASVVLFRIR